MKSDLKIAVIIVAGGSGSRMGGPVPKQFIPIGGVPVIVRTITKFRKYLSSASIITAIPREYSELWKKIKSEYLNNHSIIDCEGGETRFHSVKNALAKARNHDIIAIHDSVRPFFSKEMIGNLIDCCTKNGCAIPAIVPNDSYRMEGADGNVIIDRSQLRIIQTPQVFDGKSISGAYETNYSDRFTDDASVFEYAGNKIFLCEGDRNNIKLTTVEDMQFAEYLIEKEDVQNRL